MNYNKYIDNTLLKADATSEQIKALCEESKKYDFKSVCVNPSFISYSKECLKGSDVLVCTVIGFPLGSMTTEAKVYETKDAINKGADEIDMVINISKLKDKDYDYVKNEIKNKEWYHEVNCSKKIAEIINTLNRRWKHRPTTKGHYYENF